MKKHDVGPPPVIPDLRLVSRWLAWVGRPLVERARYYFGKKSYRNGSWDQNRGDFAQLEIRRAMGPLMRAFAPHFSYCSHCGWSWNWVESHTVEYDGGGFFVVCDWCYKQLRQYGDRATFVTYCLQLCDDWGDPLRDSTWFMAQIENDWPSQISGLQLIACKPSD